MKILNIKKLFHQNKNNLDSNKDEEKKTQSVDGSDDASIHGDDAGDVVPNYQDDDDGDRDSGINFEDDLPFNEMQLKVKELKHILYVLEKNKLIKDKQRESLE